MEKAVRKYLERYAEQESELVADFPGEWESMVVLPACQESEQLPLFLEHFSVVASNSPGRVLLIVVVNGRESASSEVHADNLRSLEILRGSWVSSSQGTANIDWGASRCFDLLIVDRASPGLRFPRRQGVGLARKIGGDVALSLWARGRCRREWIRTTDPDSRPASDYLQPIALEASAAVAWFRFEHRTTGVDTELDQAIILYEIWLRYYVLGLAWAGSPFAYHTLGSTLAFRASAYAKVRGFPRREAAEDFHFLNKLAKVGAVMRLDRSALELVSRPSNRVPFGTGVGTTKILNLQAQGEEFELFSPQCFSRLKDLLSTLRTLPEITWHQSGVPDLSFDSQLVPLIDALGLDREIAETLRQSTHPQNRFRRLHTWMDALKSLRFLHLTRDRLDGCMAWREALDAAPFLPTMTGSPLSILQQLRTLELETLPNRAGFSGKSNSRGK